MLVRETSNPWRIQDILKDAKVLIADIQDGAESITFSCPICSSLYFPPCCVRSQFSGQQNYMDALQINVLGTINIVQAAKVAGCEKLINLGSSSEYGNKKVELSMRKWLSNPVEIYGSTKAAASIISHQLALESRIPIVTLRPFGVFGESEDTHKLFGYMFSFYLKTKK